MSHAQPLLRALAFAAVAHAEQRRKGTGEPYINHLIEVAELLARLAQVADPAILQAAVLHDTLEDTSVTEAEIELSFGSRVRALVEALTDDKSLPKNERKASRVVSMRAAPQEARLIKLADLCSNIASLPSDWPLARWHAYLDWSSSVAGACSGSSPALEQEFQQRLENARAATPRDA